MSNILFLLLIIIVKKIGWKTTVWIFQASNKRNVTQEDLDMAKKGHLKRETESFLIAAQNNAIRTNYVKAKIDKMQQNSKCWTCGDRDETMNHICECSKLAQKGYKTRRDWVGKVIHCELCKKFKSTLRTNGIFTTRNPPWRMRRTKFSVIIR